MTRKIHFIEKSHCFLMTLYDRKKQVSSLNLTSKFQESLEKIMLEPVRIIYAFFPVIKYTQTQKYLWRLFTFLLKPQKELISAGMWTQELSGPFPIWFQVNNLRVYFPIFQVTVVIILSTCLFF